MRRSKVFLRQKSNILKCRDAKRKIGSLLLLLDCLQIFDQILQTDVAEILVFLDLVKDRAPDGHFASAMRQQGRIVTGNELFDSVRGKLSAITLRQHGQIGGLGFQGRCGRSIPYALRTVAGRAVSMV